MQVINKQPLELDAVALDTSRQDYENDNHYSQRNHDSRREATEVITDVENKHDAYRAAHQNGEQQGKAVIVALCP